MGKYNEFSDDKTGIPVGTIRESLALYDTGGYTVDFIEQLPDGVRAELIDGRIFYMAAPTTWHQEILLELCIRVKEYIRRKGGSCKVYPAPVGVTLMKDRKTYVEPDVAVVCDASKISEKGIEGAPDWVIEIVSPSSERMDYFFKLFQYKAAGVREYWVVDWKKDRVTVYNFAADEMTEYTCSDQVRSGIWEDLALDFSEIRPE